MITHLKCQRGRRVVTPRVCEDINNSARGCDVIRVTDPMLIAGELQQDRYTHSHSHALKHTDQNKPTHSAAPAEARLTCRCRHRRPLRGGEKDEIWAEVG